MKKLYLNFCRVEEALVKVFLVAITLLVFGSAIARTLHYPLNWATDVALLLFAWIIFLGADMALRNTELVNVDLVLNKFSRKTHKRIYIFWQMVIILFLAFIVWHGVPLAIESTSRLFQTLGISYSWATISVPIGAMLMIITTCIKINTTLKKENW